LILAIIIIVVITVCNYYVLDLSKLPESVDSTIENRTNTIQGNMIYQL
jgi:hypothetical protein